MLSVVRPKEKNWLGEKTIADVEKLAFGLGLTVYDGVPLSEEPCIRGFKRLDQDFLASLASEDMADEVLDKIDREAVESRQEPCTENIAADDLNPDLTVLGYDDQDHLMEAPSPELDVVPLHRCLPAFAGPISQISQLG